MSAPGATRPLRALVTDFAWPSLDIEREILSRVGAELVVAQTGEPDELIALASDVDAILTNWKRVPEAAVRASSGCVVIARYGVGVDNIPVQLATELGIVVANVPDFCVNEVADHALGLLLACARRLVPFTSQTRSGLWSLEHAPGLPRLAEQTLGVVGFGRIAQALVPRARGFGLRVLVYTPRLAAGGEVPGSLAAEVEVAPSLDDLLAAADYVSLNVPATQETTGLIGEHELGQMKPSAYLINTSRGALIDEDALARALRERRIAGAALDVLSREPPPSDLPMLAAPNLIITPHAAFYSDASIREVQTRAATNVATVLAGDVPEHVVNPEVLSRRRRPDGSETPS
ncbi:MAG TPA: C-terminal binding protein [Solirubrobacteraceae bacterium]|nr:C-terminal binding protein [Solirubrobacteraceae bacterium]